MPYEKGWSNSVRAMCNSGRMRVWYLGDSGGGREKQVEINNRNKKK